MLKKGTIKITLQSDLCMGSGYSFAGMIDSDVCYDDCGIPYIPARRLKGCMREAAQTALYQLLSQEKINAIFGERGQNTVVGIRIGDAKIVHYREIYAELKSFMQGNANGLVTPQRVLDLYTSVKVQTKIDRDSGAADDTTLRFIRTVNRMNPLTGEPCSFYSDIVYEDSIEQDLGNILCATRSIGLLRNRGLGAVKLEWDGKQKSNPGQNQEETLEVDRKKNYVISYQIHNIEPLMLAANDRDSSASYISGQSILGMMAARYLREQDASDDAFRDLFLNGTVKYTNATLCIQGNTYYPAPAYLAKLKIHRHIVNTYVSQDSLPDHLKHPEEYKIDGGNLPKKLKGKFVHLYSLEECGVAEVKRTLHYHNRIHDEDEPGNHLYHHEALAAGQTFAGEIILPGKYLKQVKSLLLEPYAWFGKSKTAQYGMCRIQVNQLVKSPDNIFEAKKGDTILVTLLSDGIFIRQETDNTAGTDYTVYQDELLKTIASELGDDEPISYRETSKVPSMITTKEIHGYQSVWNLRRQPVPAVCAGSVFAFTLEKDAVISRKFIGERNQEGYGQIQVSNWKDMKYFSMETKKPVPNTMKLKHAKGIATQILSEELYREVKEAFLKDTGNVKLKSPALLGRVALMLQEALESNRLNEQEAFSDFCRRILTIKTKSEQNKLCEEVIEKLAEKVMDEEKREVVGYCLKNDKIKKYLKKDGKGFLLLKELLTEDQDGNVEEILYGNLIKRWGDLLTAFFTQMKYGMKHQKKVVERMGRDESDQREKILPDRI